MTFPFPKYLHAIFLILLFHLVGFVGIAFFPDLGLVATTALNLLLMAVLLLATHSVRNTGFFLFLGLSYVTGMSVEIIGVQTGALFGHYGYGAVLGPQVAGVPILLGVNWFIVVYSSAKVTEWVLSRFLPAQSAGILWLKVLATGALAVFYDWVMEPVAIKLNYWNWGGDGSIPIYNYICWYVVSSFLALAFFQVKDSRPNLPARVLWITHIVFFTMLRLAL